MYNKIYMMMTVMKNETNEYGNDDYGTKLATVQSL